MTINKFIKICSKEDDHIGDFARDIIREEEFPFTESNEEVLVILETKAHRKGLTQIFNEFKTFFEKSK